MRPRQVAHPTPCRAYPALLACPSWLSPLLQPPEQQPEDVDNEEAGPPESLLGLPASFSFLAVAAAEASLSSFMPSPSTWRLKASATGSSPFGVRLNSRNIRARSNFCRREHMQTSSLGSERGTAGQPFWGAADLVQCLCQGHFHTLCTRSREEKGGGDRLGI